MTVPTIRDKFNPLIAKDEVGKAKQHTASKTKVDSNSVNFINVNGIASRKPNVCPKLVNELAKETKLKQAKMAEMHHAPVKIQEHPTVLDDREFGKPTLTSTPISDLIKNKFGNEGEQKTIERYREYHARDIENSHHQTEVRHTKASRGQNVRASSAPAKEPFKLSKFKRVKARVVSTFVT